LLRLQKTTYRIVSAAAFQLTTLSLGWGGGSILQDSFLCLFQRILR